MRIRQNKCDNKACFIHQKYLDFATNAFVKYLGREVRLKKQCASNAPAGMGAFYLEYLHMPTGYTIELDCQRLTFSLILRKRKNEFITINAICQEILNSDYGADAWDDSEMTELNIDTAIKELAKALTLYSGDLFFYQYKRDGIYKAKGKERIFLQGYNKPFKY